MNDCHRRRNHFPPASFPGAAFRRARGIRACRVRAVSATLLRMPHPHEAIAPEGPCVGIPRVNFAKLSR